MGDTNLSDSMAPASASRMGPRCLMKSKSIKNLATNFTNYTKLKTRGIRCWFFCLSVSVVECAHCRSSRTAERTFMKFGLFLFCMTLATPLSSARLSPQYVKWLEHEAVYIISSAENKEFNRLTTDAERDAFIEKFWKLRDTDSSTQENEFRKEHYARIRHANERFADGVPGWKTDRGRIWILHGPPDDIHYEYGGGSVGIDIEKPTAVLTEDANPDHRRSYRLTISKPETEIWLYRHIEGARNFPTYFQVIFSRTDPTQTYQLNQTLRQIASRANLDYPERVQRDATIKVFLRGHFFGGPFRILYAGQYKFQDLDDFYQSIFHPLRMPMISVGDFQEGIQDLERSSGEVLMEKLSLARALREKVRSR